MMTAQERGDSQKNSAAAIYVIQHRTETAQHVMVALSALLLAADRIIVVADIDNQEVVAAALSDLNTHNRIEVIPSDQKSSVLSAYRTGLLHLQLNLLDLFD